VTSPRGNEALSRVGTKKGEGQNFYCPHQFHGGNGKFFTQAEVDGDYELKEAEVSALLEAAAKDVLNGKTTIDAAVRELAKITSRTTTQVREALTIMTDTIEKKDAEKVEQATAVKAARARRAAPAAAAPAKAAKAPAAPRVAREKATGEQFAGVIAALGLTPKQAAEACGEATPPMGKSATYIYILTHSGASADLFAKFETALKAYAKRNKIKAPKPAAAAAVATAE
jgi:hypothetical protein